MKDGATQLIISQHLHFPCLKLFCTSLMLIFLCSMAIQVASALIKALMCVCFGFQAMEGLPDFAIPAVLSFFTTRDVCRCALISKEWDSCAQSRRIEIKEEAARGRAQVHQ